MPIVEHSSFSRGFDVGSRPKRTVGKQMISTELPLTVPPRIPLRKFAAFAIVLVMAASAFAMLIPTSTKKVDLPAVDVPAGTEYGGVREVSYEISKIGESYLKVSDNISLGQGGSVSGINSWWPNRTVGYGDMVVRDKFPYSIVYDPCGWSPGGAQLKLGFGVYSFYHLAIVAQNLTTIGTAAGSDPLFIPILNTTTPSQAGGWVNWSYHLTYLTVPDSDQLVAGVNYANVYFGVDPTIMESQFKSNANDGWFVEIAGKVEFDVQAAKRFLGLGGVRDLRAEFREANALNAINDSWNNDWAAEGSAGGMYDVYAAYLYSLDAYANSYFTGMTVDPSSTATKLVLRLWHKSWGGECLMQRYMDVSGVASHWDFLYPDDVWLNGTVGPSGGDLSYKGRIGYDMQAWKDPVAWAPTWLVEPMHDDYIAGNTAHSSWKSHFDPYMQTVKVKPTKMEWAPGTTAFGQRTAYWYTPDLWNLSAGESFTIKLGNSPAWGIDLYASSGAQGDKIDQAKVDELNSHGMWGELVLGRTLPDWLYSPQYYNNVTKTVRLDGPMNFAGNFNPTLPRLNETGEPLFPLTVAKVSDYVIAGLPSTPMAGIPYSITVTAKNFTGVTVTNWNGTVVLSSNNPGGVTFSGGSRSHTYVPADNGVWTVSVTFGAQDTNSYLNASDSIFWLDVMTSTGPMGVDPLIAEFPTLLIPVIGAVAVFVVFGRRKATK